MKYSLFNKTNLVLVLLITLTTSGCIYKERKKLEEEKQKLEALLKAKEDSMRMADSLIASQAFDGSREEVIQPEVREESSEKVPSIAMEDFPVPDGYQLLYNPQGGFAICFPEDWKMNRENLTSVVMFMSPKTSDADFFQENININVEAPDPPIYSIEEYFQATLNGIRMMMPDAKITYSKNITLSGLPGKHLVYTGKFGDYNLTWNQVYVLKGTEAWIITGTALETSYGSYKPRFEKAISTFTFL